MSKVLKIVVAAVAALGIVSIGAPLLWGDAMSPSWVKIDNYAFLLFLAASVSLLVLWLARAWRSTKRPSRGSGARGEPKGDRGGK